MSNDLTTSEAAELTPFTRRPNGCGIETATKLARVLIGSYPKEPHEPEVYTRAIISVLAEQPLEIAKKAVDRVTRALKFLPTRADICEAIAEIRTEQAADMTRQSKDAEIMAQRARWDSEEQERKADRERLRETLGDSWEAWWAVPLMRRYSGLPVDFAAGWKAADDKQAFCDAWGRA
jgi:hypothetical protein